MQEHPLTITLWRKALALGIGLIALFIQGGLLMYYVGLPFQAALADSFLSVISFGTAVYLYGFAVDYLRVFPLWAILPVGVQGIWIGVSFMGIVGMGWEARDEFAHTLPLRFLLGLLAWIIVVEWYEQQRRINKLTEENTPEPETPLLPSSIAGISSTVGTPPSEESITAYPDRISVKDGSRIHIIPVEDILYLQASGDYVTVFTFDGQYVKEQTMKYFETHLSPAGFIRIHRSYLINANHILRVELFGKENYQVRLKNDVRLRASLTGYKVLKEKLGL